MQITNVVVSICILCVLYALLYPLEIPNSGLLFFLCFLSWLFFCIYFLHGCIYTYMYTICMCSSAGIWKGNKERFGIWEHFCLDLFVCLNLFTFPFISTEVWRLVYVIFFLSHDSSLTLLPIFNCWPGAST